MYICLGKNCVGGEVENRVKICKEVTFSAKLIVSLVPIPKLDSQDPLT
jgi:hypothetical protein